MTTKRTGYQVMNEMLEGIAPSVTETVKRDDYFNASPEQQQLYVRAYNELQAEQPNIALPVSIIEERMAQIARQSARTASEQRDLINFRVEYIAPTKPEHAFEPRCAILADSAQYGNHQ